MDWSKAKSILILAFIITNTLLGSMFLFGKDMKDTSISKEFIEKSIEILNENDIKIKAEVPSKLPSLNSLIVEYEAISPLGLRDKFFQEEADIKKVDKNLVEIIEGSKSLTIINDKLIIYEEEDGKETIKDLDEKKAKEIAVDFLKKRGYKTDDKKLSFIKEDGGIFYVEFSKIYGENFLESAFTNFQIDKRGVKKFERLWLNVIEEGQIPIYISTAPKAILGLLSIDEAYGKTVRDISLIYYFEPNQHEYIEEPEEAKQGKAIPAWRIQFEDGYKVFIDDY